MLKSILKLSMWMFKSTPRSVLKKVTQKYVSPKISRSSVEVDYGEKFQILVTTRSYTADAVWYRQPSGQPTNMVMLNSNELRVEKVSWQWSVGRVTVPRLSTWHDVPWRSMTRRDMTWQDVTWRDMTWHDVRNMTWHEVTLRDMTWYDMTWGEITWHDVTWRNMTWLTWITWHDVTWRDVIQTW